MPEHTPSFSNFQIACMLFILSFMFPCSKPHLQTQFRTDSNLCLLCLRSKDNWNMKSLKWLTPKLTAAIGSVCSCIESAGLDTRIPMRNSPGYPLLNWIMPPKSLRTSILHIRTSLVLYPLSCQLRLDFRLVFFDLELTYFTHLTLVSRRKNIFKNIYNIS